MFSLESRHRGDSKEHTQHTIIKIKKYAILNHPKYNNVCSYGIFSKELKNEFETAVVNEPSVFQPLKFYCSKDRIGLAVSDILKSQSKVYAEIMLVLPWKTINTKTNLQTSKSHVVSI